MAHRRAVIVSVVTLGLIANLIGVAPAHSAGSARIEGTVTAPGGGAPDAPVQVVLSTTSWDSPVSTYFTTIDPLTGAYGFEAPAGGYYLRFEYLGEANILPTIWSNGTTDSFFAGQVTLTADSTLVFDRALVPGAAVTGTATGLGGVPLESLSVVGVSHLTHGRSSFDPESGQYVLDRLPHGSYRIDFTSTARWKKGSIGSPNITLVAGEVRTGQDIVLAPATTIEGHLAYRVAPTGVYPHGIGVQLRNPSTGATTAYTASGADGSFHMYGVTPGTYQVCVFAGGARPLNAFTNCWGDQPVQSAPTISVSNGQVLSGIDILVDPAGSIEGRVLARVTPSSAASPLATARVTAYRFTGGGYVTEASTTVQLDGTFAIGPLTPGQYSLRFSDDDKVFNPEYWDDERYFGSATDVTVVTGSVLALSDVILDGRTLEVSRLSGLDRFDVGVSVSQALYPEVPLGGVPVVYIANGFNFPDALTASPAAAFEGGAVLLVAPESIPPAVAAELARLRPQRIVVAGGPASVSPAVFEQLKGYVASPSDDVVRAGGVDRYEASRTIVRAAFEPSGADIAIIATGSGFPDALSAGPAAASQGGPVILVDGSASSIDDATRQLINDLDIQVAYIAGGTGSVSPGVEASLKSLLGDSNVIRFAGADRFAVGVLISQEFFSSADHVFVATGFKFPDALTGGPLAAAYGGPLYLSRPECLPADVGFDILGLEAQQVVLLGGPGSLSPAVEQLQVC